MESARTRAPSRAVFPGKRRGQTVVFEQVLLFSVGIVIFLACAAVFSIAQGFYVQNAATDQLRQVKDLLAGEIEAAAAAGNATNSSTDLEVPREVQGEVYQIVLQQAGLNLTVPFYGVSAFSGLGGAGALFNLSGAITSSNGRVTVAKALGTIRIL